MCRMGTKRIFCEPQCCPRANHQREASCRASLDHRIRTSWSVVSSANTPPGLVFVTAITTRLNESIYNVSYLNGSAWHRGFLFWCWYIYHQLHPFFASVIVQPAGTENLASSLSVSGRAWLSSFIKGTSSGIMAGCQTGQTRIESHSPLQPASVCIFILIAYA